MDERALPAIIIGGGLGGLLTATALRSVGFDAQVYEKATSRGDSTGTLISIFPNGVKSLKSINPSIYEKLLQQGATWDVSTFIKQDGSVLKSSETEFVRLYGEPTLCCRWSTILDTFRQFLPDDSVHTGCTFEGRVEEGCMVIGADGVRSKVRATVLGERNVEPNDNGRTIWLCLLPRIHPEVHPPHTSVAGVGAGVVGFTHDPGEGNMYGCFAVTDEASQGATKARSANGAEAKERVLGFYKDWPTFTPIIEAMDPERIVERRVLDLPELPTWRKGRILLIGDAAHAVTPTIGQGANMTFEDALELAHKVSEHAFVEEALAAFEALRKPRVTSIAQGNKSIAAAAFAKPSGADGAGGAGGVGVAPPAFKSRDELNDFIYKYERLDMPLEARASA
eukprot:jgi/Mesen1/409/ME000100S10647